jgi:hypothetical protein
MFSDIGPLEVVTLVVLDVILVGPDKLPKRRCHVVGCVSVSTVCKAWSAWGVGSGSGRRGLADSSGDLLPDREADGHLGSVVGCGHEVAAGPEVG